MEVNVILLLAMVLEGEAGLVPDAMPVVANVVMNRVESDHWPNDVVSVLNQPHQFNGRQSPSLLAYYHAKRALRRDEEVRQKYQDLHFVISGKDRQRLGCDIGDRIYVNWNWSVHAYEEWCGKEKG